VNDSVDKAGEHEIALGPRGGRSTGQGEEAEADKASVREEKGERNRLKQ